MPGMPGGGYGGQVPSYNGAVHSTGPDGLSSAARPKRMRSDTKIMMGGAFPDCIKMINQLMNNKSAAPFLQPVDPIALGIPDYPTIITRPMDLSTIQTNLQYGAYANAEEFAEDVRLVWNNCEKYNGAEHYITHAANGLRKIFEKSFAQLKTKEFEPLPEGYIPPQMKGKPPKKAARLDNVVPHARAEMSYEEKRALCSHINALDAKYLGRVIQIINRCLPNILDERAPGQEEIEISVESLTNSALRELEDYVKELKVQQVI
jgi:bromodomain-containing factor 1